MRMHRIEARGAQPAIDSYGPGGFRIAGAWIAGGLLVGPPGVQPLADPFGESGVAAAEALAGKIDVLLVGTGAEIRPVPAAVRTRLEAAGMGVEIMSTPAACRTYTVLLGEERRVAALLGAV